VDYVSVYIHNHIYTHMFEYTIMMRKRETFYDYNYTRIVFIIVYCTVSYNSSHCTLLYIYVCKHIYTHIPRAHTYV